MNLDDKNSEEGILFYFYLFNFNNSNKYEILAQRALVTIDGQITGTFVCSLNDYLKGPVFQTVNQIWLAYVESKGDYYLISFAAPPSSFAKPENVEAHSQFIKSMKFLGTK